MNRGRLYALLAVLLSLFTIYNSAKLLPGAHALAGGATVCLVLAIYQLMSGKTVTWLFVPPLEKSSAKERWLWWEKRRFVYNLIVGLTGFVSLVTSMFYCDESGSLPTGEDYIEPALLMLMFVFGPIVWNTAYSLGPVVDNILSRFENTKKSGPILLKSGIAFSLFLMCVPLILWLYTWAGMMLGIATFHVK